MKNILFLPVEDQKFIFLNCTREEISLQCPMVVKSLSHENGKIHCVRWSAVTSIFSNIKFEKKNSQIYFVVFRSEISMTKKLEQLLCEQYLQAFEISRSFLRAKQLGEMRGKIQKPLKIARKAAVLFLFSL